MDTGELLDDHDAVGLADLVRRREVAPTELLDAVLRRIEERDPTLRAFVSTRVDAARAEAAGELPDGPLRGVPFAVKDLACDVAGMVSSQGSRLFADAVAARDGALTTRYRRAGLIVVGKTNSPEFGKNASTEPLLHGPSHNPWRTTHSTGGSSGGSAAAVAGGILPAAHANDGGGSIRIPAACCGLFGLKPSRGRVPDDHGLSALAYPLSVAHAVTRTVRDSAALLDVVAGPLPGDPYAALPAPAAGSFLAALEAAPTRLRVGFATANVDGVAAHPAAVRAVERTAALLAELGHRVEEAAPVWDGPATGQALGQVMSAATHVQIEDRLAELGRELRADDIEPFTRVIHERTAAMRGPDLVRALQTVVRIGREVAPFFEAYDVWLSPTLGVPVPELGVLDTSDPASMYTHAVRMTWFTSVFNVTGLPSASVPAGFDEAGLPVAVQLTGRLGAEAQLLRVAAQLEEAAPWPRQAPWPPAELGA
ncbi:amidase [Embleya hyalina]|uniref:6-aminohexanoate-cyclic-dimer hydrolase n=1 Tax=Embleya hyalina TaxID=516124 RepID=A0A401YPZ4_9ACTN|nr:amidase family protein [Embleya hyalina]GCD96662.1 6-aminohexanoate-cyclic-dimer hydrolase [Embleya hyalina]